MAGAQQSVRDNQGLGDAVLPAHGATPGPPDGDAPALLGVWAVRGAGPSAAHARAPGLDGDLPPLVDPDVARDYVHVDDVCEAYRLAAASHLAPEPGSVYNGGTGIQTKLREVVDVARRALPIAVEPRWGSMPRRGWDTGVWLSDSRRIRAELGWHPASSL